MPYRLRYRGEWSRTKLAHNDINGLQHPAAGNKVSMWNGSHTFTCLAREYAVVESLAKEVASFFELYAYQIAELLCINEIKVNGISEPKVIPEDRETFETTVDISYSLMNHWLADAGRMPIRHIFSDISVSQFALNVLK